MEKHNIKDWITPVEDIIYECVIEDEKNGYKYDVYLTNKRIIWKCQNSAEEFINTYMLKFINEINIRTGFENYSENGDVGTGEYGVVFAINSSYFTLWFYDENVWKDFYTELSRTIIENQ